MLGRALLFGHTYLYTCYLVRKLLRQVSKNNKRRDSMNRYILKYTCKRFMTLNWVTCDNVEDNEDNNLHSYPFSSGHIQNMAPWSMDHPCRPLTYISLKKLNWDPIFPQSQPSLCSQPFNCTNPKFRKA